MTKTGLYYNDALTGVDVAARDEVLRYIRESVVPALLREDPAIQKRVAYCQVVSTDSVAQCAARFAHADPANSLICIYAYGSHVQKMVSAVEVYKKTLDGAVQWNRLTMFRSVEPGVNELLEKKKIVPVLVAFITTSADLNSAVFDNDLHMFTKQ
ncbi:ribonuclease P/MRP protein subunit [Maudiozyma humilis]|uniref:Ribonuclease P/MRP protein subunit n=1 Tax=Maudiozyma humilis TaxID=51915 RepID=A0AAV5S1V4_MAUHU|nr:ribonuclease P/MRP protein subunit [Kazachstania humilis]